MDKNMWMVRAGKGGILFDNFKENNIIALGFDEIGDITDIDDIEHIKKLSRDKYPKKNELAIGKIASQIYTFIRDFQQKDFVVTYDSKQRNYLIGQIASQCEYNEEMIKEGYNKIRKVKWQKTIPRDNLTISTRNALIPMQTIFKIRDNAKSELLSILYGEEIPKELYKEEESTSESLMEETIGRSQEFIKDKIMDLEWDEMQELVAGLLRAMGYKTIITGTGPDRGRDIVASSDGLGLEGPKIKVEVKHQKNPTGAPDIRKFLGGLRKGQKGIYVSTGGFTKEAYYEGERANFPISLVDIDLFLSLLIQYYDNFDIETKSFIPLKKIYWPVDID